MDLTKVKEKIKRDYQLEKQELRGFQLKELDALFQKYQGSIAQAKNAPESYRKQIQDDFDKREDSLRKTHSIQDRMAYNSYLAAIETAEKQFLEQGGTQQEVEATREHRIIEGVVPDSEPDSKNIEEEKEKKKQSILQTLFKGKKGKEKDAWSR